MLLAIQDKPSSLGGAIDFLQDPVFLEIVAITAGVAILLGALLRIRSSLHRLEGRRLLVKYLDGVEACLSGDPETAATVLGSVVDADPENVGARLALGDALYGAQRPVAAHQQHMEAREVFAAGGPQVDLALVKDLRAAGELAEALERVDAALAEHAKDEALLEEAWSLKSEAGAFEGALTAGRSLFQRRGGAKWRERLAGTAARAGMLALSRGEPERAADLFRESLGYDEHNREARTGRALIGSPDDLPLLGEGVTDGPLMLTGADSPAARVLAIFPEAVCGVCGTPREGSAGNGEHARCPSCGDSLPAVYADAELADTLKDAEASVDEIEETDAWFRRLALLAREGDDGARRALIEGGGKALHPLLTTLFESGDSQARLREIVVLLGQRDPEALIDARGTLKAQGRGMLDRLTGRRDPDPALAPVFRRLGPAARECFTAVVNEAGGLADRGLRGLVVDYFVGLADLSAFEDLAARYAPVEIVRNLNRMPAEEVAPLIALLPEGPSFLADAILLDPALEQPNALVLAALQAPEDLQPRFAKVFAARGPGAHVLAALVHHLDEDQTRAKAEQLLTRFRADGLEHLVAAFADPDTPGSAHPSIARLIAACGEHAVPPLVRCFGSAPTEGDDRVVALLASLGEVAVTPLGAAYSNQSRWLGRVGANLLRGRYTRSCIVRALGAIEGAVATKALGALAAEETDPELASLVREVRRRKETP